MFRWFSIFTTLFLGLSLLVLGGLAKMALPKRTSWEPTMNAVATNQQLPQFFEESEDLEALNQGPLELKWSEPKLRLPNLRQTLLFYGVCQRPDLPENATYLHVGLTGCQDITLFDAEKPIYLSYESHVSSPNHMFDTSRTSQTQEGYVFSPENAPTSLWLEAGELTPNGCTFHVKMKDENGDMLVSPKENASFKAMTKEIPKNLLIGWQMGDYRVDSTLLIRQKARWIGQDRFLEIHGGSLFGEAAGKERLDFTFENEPYSCFVQEGDSLFWKEGKWCSPGSPQQSMHSPLLTLRKVEENVLHFQLWDPEGKGHIQVNLVRSKDMTPLPKIEQEFKFIGAKTWSKFIVESRNERLTLKAHDWLVLTEQGGWVSLNTPQLIQDYLEGKLQGPLLVLDKLVKTGGGQTLVGHLFNTSRTEVTPISLESSPNGTFGSTLSSINEDMDS